MALTKNIFLILFLSYSTFCISQNNWELAAEKSQVQLFTKVNNDSNFKSFKAITTMEAPLHQILSAIMDVAALPEYYDMIVEVLDYDQKSETSASYGLKFDFPFPVKDRYCDVFSEVSQLEDGTVKVFTKKVDNGKSKSNLVSVAELTGVWLLKKIDDTHTSVIHHGHMDPSGSIPAWLANKNVVESPYNSVVNLRKLISRYADHQVSWLK